MIDAANVADIQFQIVNFDLDIAKANVRENIKRDLPRLRWQPPRCSPVSICGAGPSLRKTYGTMKGDVAACNSAFGWLVNRGINVRYAFIWDANPITLQFAKPYPGVTYFVASRCDPKVFEALSGCDVIMWHADGDEGIGEWLHEHGENTVRGGSAAVTRASFMFHVLGYRDIHLFGADSSYVTKVGDTSATHVGGASLVPESELIVTVGHEWFQTTPWLAAQADEFRAIYAILADNGTTVTVHGDGLLPAIWKRERAIRQVHHNKKPIPISRASLLSNAYPISKAA